MHIITRQVGDVIVRNDDVEILVLSVDDKQVRLGIEIRDGDRFRNDCAIRDLKTDGGRREK